MSKRTYDPRAIISGRPAFMTLLDSPAVRHLQVEEHLLYSVLDVLTALLRIPNARSYWKNLVLAQSELANYMVDVSFESGSPTSQAEEPATDLAGILRILESVAHPRAETARRWLAEVGAAHTQEGTDPELAVLRARQEYERRGFPPQWIDRRMRAVATRAQIVSEWHKRGAEESEHYRDLTNALYSTAFDMNVESYRKTKGLSERDNLRDHMSEVELALITLGETVGTELHRLQGSHSVPELLRDMHDAGAIIAEARKRIEQASGHRVIGPSSPPGLAAGGHA